MEDPFDFTADCCYNDEAKHTGKKFSRGIAGTALQADDFCCTQGIGFFVEKNRSPSQISGGKGDR